MGDVSRQLKVNSKDEIGQLASSFQQITSTIQQVAQGALQQSMSAQATSDSVDQLNRAISRVAEGAQTQARIEASPSSPTR